MPSSSSVNSFSLQRQLMSLADTRIKRVVKTTVITFSYEAPTKTRCQPDQGCSTTEIGGGWRLLGDLALNPRAQDSELTKPTFTRFGTATLDGDSISVSNTGRTGAPSGGWLRAGKRMVKDDDLGERLTRSTITTR